ncbi:MAG TPA: serine/threonine-protein kinase, partial [Trichocoleus sp.]
MTYCPNPTCPAPHNPDSAQFCLGCGVGLVLGRYQLLKLLGQGGFGKTFLALAEPSSKDSSVHSVSSLCVVKQLLLREAESSRRFQAEAQHLKQLGTHPQIPSFWEAFEQDGQGYLVQSYIEGQTLEQVLAEEGVFGEAQIWQVLNDLLPVLQFIHDRKVIHRDIKPANLIRPARPSGKDARLILVDFGAAKWVHSTPNVRQETVIGSAEYVAPEQARGKAVFASDLYSLGLTCLHLLTGLSPFDLFDPVNHTWAWQQALTQPVSEPLAALLNHLLQNALNQRFQSA